MGTPNLFKRLRRESLGRDTQKIHTLSAESRWRGSTTVRGSLSRYPGCVRSLLLTNSDTEPDSSPAAVEPVIELARVGKFADEWIAPWLADKKLARSEKGIGGPCYLDPSHPTDEAIETYLGPLVESLGRKVLTNAYAVGRSPNPLVGVEAALKSGRVPTRIVWGAADKIFSQASPDYLDRTFTHSCVPRWIASVNNGGTPTGELFLGTAIAVTLVLSCSFETPGRHRVVLVRGGLSFRVCSSVCLARSRA